MIILKFKTNKIKYNSTVSKVIESNSILNKKQTLPDNNSIQKIIIRRKLAKAKTKNLNW